MHEALVACGHHLVGFGGHAHAAGLEIEMQKLDAFTQAMNQFANDTLSIDALGKVIHYDQSLSVEQISFGLIADLTGASPYGRGNPEPVFRFNNLRVQNVRILKDIHLKATCVANPRIELIAFGMAEKEGLFAGPIDVLAVPTN